MVSDALSAVRRRRAAAPRVDLWGQPVASDDLPSDRVNLRPVLEAWPALEGAVITYLDAWDQRVAPLARRLEAGEDVGEALAGLVARLRIERRAFEPHVEQLRATARFSSELRPSVLVLLSALERCDRAHQDQLGPALATGDPESLDSAPREVSPDEVTRRLRASIDSEPERTGPRSPWARWWSWLLGSDR